MAELTFPNPVLSGVLQQLFSEFAEVGRAARQAQATGDQRPIEAGEPPAGSPDPGGEGGND